MIFGFPPLFTTFQLELPEVLLVVAVVKRREERRNEKGKEKRKRTNKNNPFSLILSGHVLLSNFFKKSGTCWLVQGSRRK